MLNKVSRFMTKEKFFCAQFRSPIQRPLQIIGFSSSKPSCLVATIRLFTLTLPYLHWPRHGVYPQPIGGHLSDFMPGKVGGVFDRLLHCGYCAAIRDNVQPIAVAATFSHMPRIIPLRFQDGTNPRPVGQLPDC